jgi:hypothetical protein
MVCEAAPCCHLPQPQQGGFLCRHPPRLSLLIKPDGNLERSFDVAAEIAHGFLLAGARRDVDLGIPSKALHSGPARRKIRWRSPTTIRLSRGQDAADVTRVQGERQRSLPTLRQLPWSCDPGATNGALHCPVASVSPRQQSERHRARDVGLGISSKLRRKSRPA